MFPKPERVEWVKENNTDGVHLEKSRGYFWCHTITYAPQERKLGMRLLDGRFSKSCFCTLKQKTTSAEEAACSLAPPTTSLFLFLCYLPRSSAPSWREFPFIGCRQHRAGESCALEGWGKGVKWLFLEKCLVMLSRTFKLSVISA